MKQKPVINENSRNVEDIIIPPKKGENIERIKIIIIKMEHYEITKLLNDSTLSKFVAMNWSNLKFLC